MGRRRGQRKRTSEGRVRHAGRLPATVAVAPFVWRCRASHRPSGARIEGDVTRASTADAMLVRRSAETCEYGAL